MEFGVHTPDQPELFFYGDSRYEIYAAVLMVFDDDNKKKITFSPSGWLRGGGVHRLHHRVRRVRPLNFTRV
jgi:hypothetical protein